MITSMINDVVPYEYLTDRELVRIFCEYLTVVARQGRFQLPRQAMIAELERMSEWLRENQKVQQFMNGGRQL